jgi:hypothetical protein
MLPDIDFTAAVRRLCRERGVDLAQATISQRVAIGEAAKELLRDRIDKRHRLALANAGKSRHGQPYEVATPLSQLVADAVGIYVEIYRRARRVIQVADDSQAPRQVRRVAQAAVAHMDETGQVYGAYRAVLAAMNGRALDGILTIRRRRPLDEAARDAGWALRRDVERIQRIYADDRYLNNKDQVTAQLGSHLTFAADALTKLIADHIDPTKEATNG